MDTRWWARYGMVSSLDDEYIASLIGPPLHSTFMKLFYSEDNDLIEDAIDLYRKRYSEVGVFESKVYPGITELLELLYKNSYRLWVLTFKPRIWTEIIIKYFSFDQWLSGVFAPTLDERLLDKIELIESALLTSGMIPSNTAIVGDRKEDIIAGSTSGIMTIAVTYGYGSREEIVDAVPNYICNSPNNIQYVIMSN